MLSKIKQAVKNKIVGQNFSKTWKKAQEYELKAAFEYMETPFFKEVHQSFKNESDKISNGYLDKTMTNEFFNDSEEDWREFTEFVNGKSMLDVGPCIASPWRRFDTASKRYAIEPLLKSVDQWQKDNLGFSLFSNIQAIDTPAEDLAEELVGKIDGAILCRNMLDHTPDWPFVLVNISKYAQTGCKLLLWTDLNHGNGGDEGHFDITLNPKNFKSLVEALGFKVIREFKDTSRISLNWGCFAEKI